MTIPWDIPATLRTVSSDSAELTLRQAIEAFRDLPATEQHEAEILFYFERERGRIGRDAIEKYVELLE
ncbi:hypothetical protein [Sphingomonas crocodyli]|uniref:Uncharacterized protein n=1 Tax=Sphingomonas crocodyli TaxID=1979270 RepID=A0A437LXY7_9SPHN|nr:hypothetical protein [Sphingomonas crocodyli]RVT90224.1 hypothetical protein EOD43_18170 [Sphingomonas crocodyli]